MWCTEISEAFVTITSTEDNFLLLVRRLQALLFSL